MKKHYFFAFSIWILFSLFTTGYDSPDEHFPTLEATGGLLFGYWYPTWEWDAGLRSWIQPLIQAAWLWPFTQIGITDRIWLDSLARILNSILWLLGALFSKKISQNMGADEKHQDLTGLSVLISFPFVVWGTRHGSDLFCIPFLLGAIRYLTDEKKLPCHFFIFGLLSAITFQIRFTTGPLILFVTMSFFWNHRDRFNTKNLLVTVFGFFLSFLTLNTLDAILYKAWSGASFFALYEFFKFNILESSKQFHASPFWEPALYFILLLLPYWVFTRKNTFRYNERWLLSPIIAMIALFSYIRHFEFRFLIPTLALTVLVVGKDNRALKANAVFLLLALIFYRDPHGSQIHALKNLDNTPVVLVDYTGGPPVFYSEHPHSFKNLSSDEWKRVCQSDLQPLTSQPTKTWRSWPGRLTAVTYDWSKFQAISPEKCAQPSNQCRLNVELSDSLGRSLRKKFSQISSPSFVYDCSLK